MLAEITYIKRIICVTIISIVILVMFTSCGYQLYTDITEKKLRTNNIRSIILCSYDPFGPITRAIITELHASRIDIFNDLNDDMCTRETQIARLNIIDAVEKHITTSVFQNGKEAGYQLILHIQTNFFIPNRNCYPISINVYRSLIKNPEKALFNDRQENDIRKEIYKDAAQQLIHQLFLRRNRKNQEWRQK